MPTLRLLCLQSGALCVDKQKLALHAERSDPLLQESFIKRAFGGYGEAGAGSSSNGGASTWHVGESSTHEQGESSHQQSQQDGSNVDLQEPTATGEEHGGEAMPPPQPPAGGNRPRRWWRPFRRRPDYRYEIVSDILGRSRWPDYVPPAVPPAGEGERQAQSSSSEEEEDGVSTDSSDDDDDDDDDGGGGVYQRMLQEQFDLLHMSSNQVGSSYQHGESSWQGEQQEFDEREIHQKRLEALRIRRERRTARMLQASREQMARMRAVYDSRQLDGIKAELDDLLRLPGIHDGYGSMPVHRGQALTEEEKAARKRLRLADAHALIEQVQSSLQKEDIFYREITHPHARYRPQSTAPHLPTLRNDEANLIGITYNAHVDIMQRYLRQKRDVARWGRWSPAVDPMDQIILYHALMARKNFRMIQRRMHLIQERYMRKVRKMRGEDVDDEEDEEAEGNENGNEDEHDIDEGLD